MRDPPPCWSDARAAVRPFSCRQKSFQRTEGESKAEGRVYSFLVQVHTELIKRRKLRIGNAARVYWLRDTEFVEFAHRHFTNKSFRSSESKCDQIVFEFTACCC